jgi:glycosyltransferase involved in cell wall biosynthesis
MNDFLISIVVPVYNQGDHISDVLESYIDALKSLDYPHEIIAIVNGSPDNSLDVCQSLERKHPSIRVFGEKQKGWGFSVKKGLAEAKGNLLCYTNSARTSPEELVRLINYGIKNPDSVVLASRKNRKNGLRQIGSIFYNLLSRYFFNLYTWDINGTPKVFPRNFQKLLQLKRDDDLIDLEFNITCHSEGYPVIEVPVFFSNRFGGVSTTNFVTAYRLYSRLIMLWLNQKNK